MPLDEKAVRSIRSEFPALMGKVNGRPVVFFDGPGGTQVHGSVIELMKRYFTSANSNTHAAYLYSRRTDEAVHEGRCAVADLLNASKPEEIVFGPNMTTLTFRLSQAIGDTLSPGDEIVVTRLDHDANIAPWLTLQAKGARVRFVDFDQANGTLDMDEMAKAINKRTRVVAFGYASNALGTINDVRSIVALAHSYGAWAFVDAVHYAPHGPIDVRSLGCDFLVCSAYKFFGPHTGVLYGRYEILESLPARKVRPAGEAPPDKFETGTHNFEGICGTSAAVEYLASVGRRFGDGNGKEPSASPSRRGEIRSGMSAIRAYEKSLGKALLTGLLRTDGVRVYGISEEKRSDQRVPTFAFTVRGLRPREVAAKLDTENIFVWDGHFYAVEAIRRLGLMDEGGVVRVGLYHYNIGEEVEMFLRAVSKLRGN